MATPLALRLALGGLLVEFRLLLRRTTDAQSPLKLSSHILAATTGHTIDLDLNGSIPLDRHDYLFHARPLFAMNL